MDPVLPYAPACDRTLDADTAHAIGMMLNAYTEWLNTWQTFNGQDPTYTPTQFLDHKPDAQLWGAIEIAAIYDSTDHTVLALRIHDGDEGGPHGLTGWWDEYPVWEHTGAHNTPHPDNYKLVGHTRELRHMTQEFDTGLTIAMQDGTLTYHGQDHPST